MEPQIPLEPTDQGPAHPFSRFTEVPAKIPSSQRAGPVLFNGYGYIGMRVPPVLPSSLALDPAHRLLPLARDRAVPEGRIVGTRTDVRCS